MFYRTLKPNTRSFFVKQIQIYKSEKSIINCYTFVFKIVSLLFFLGVNSVFAQNNSGFNIIQANSRAKAITGFVRCATVEYEKKQSEKYSNKPSEKEFESWMSAKVAQVKKSKANGRLAAEVYNIPVVIHIIHNGDDVNSVGNIVGENISDVQAKSQIEVLNQDYRRMLGTPGGINSTGAAVDVGINFYLAKQDVDGLETTGVIRHQITPYTNKVRNGSGGDDWETYEDVQQVKAVTQWDSTQYLNLWVLRLGGKETDEDGLNGVLGYAQFPSNSGLQGIELNGGAASTDGVVISYDAFGTINKNDGSFSLNDVYNQGRTATHEVGHWLGLRHIWGDTDTCENGDYCLDTPNATEEHYDCNTYDTCFNDGLGEDMVQNYMDYTNDSCMDTFTQDQKNRMIAVLKNSPRRVELLSSIRANSPLYSNKDLKDFVVDANPVINKTSIIGFAEGIVKMTLFNSQGKLMFLKESTDDDTIFTQELDFSSLASGVYILLIENEGRKIVKRIIKQ